jgi:predicted oxidoreductase (fatty acid repression mutant protein)
LERYFNRIDGFRDGVAVALIFEDISVRGQLREAWQISDEQAWAFAEQGIGMVQLSLWLALTAEGLATSLQHWEWLIGDCLMDFSGLPRDRFRPVAMMPIGYPDEEPRPIERIALHRVLSEDHYRGEPLDD